MALHGTAQRSNKWALNVKLYLPLGHTVAMSYPCTSPSPSCEGAYQLDMQSWAQLSCFTQRGPGPPQECNGMRGTGLCCAGWRVQAGDA